MADEKKKAVPQQMTVFEAGRLGGERTAETHGRDFYERIGREGGKASGRKNRRDVNNGNGIPRRTGRRG